MITASIILLLSGVSFLGAIQDALTAFPLTAGARILEAIMATAGAIAGVSGGLTLARVVGFGLGRLDPGQVTFAGPGFIAIGGAVSAAAYAFSSYAPYRSLLPIAVIAAGAMALYSEIDDADVGIAWASGVAALVIGLVSYAAAGRFRVPALVVVTAAIVPLLPGLTIFRALAMFSERDSSQGLLEMATAAAIAIAISSAVILGQYIAQPLRREARRLESKLAARGSSARSACAPRVDEGARRTGSSLRATSGSGQLVGHTAAARRTVFGLVTQPQRAERRHP